MGEETYWALNFLPGVENVYWKFDGRKTTRIQVIEEGWSWFWWDSSAVYTKLNKGNDLVVPAVTKTT